MDLEDIFTAIATGATDAVGAVAPLGVPVLVLLVGIGVGLRLFGKFGVKR